jgi:hypothetical protein
LDLTSTNKLAELESSLPSPETVQQVLELRLYPKEYFVIPPEENAEFVAHMGDIPNLYQQPADPKRPLICMDELPVQCRGPVVPCLPSQGHRCRQTMSMNATALRSTFCSPTLWLVGFGSLFGSIGWLWIEERESEILLDVLQAEHMSSSATI